MTIIELNKNFQINYNPVQNEHQIKKTTDQKMQDFIKYEDKEKKGRRFFTKIGDSIKGAINKRTTVKAAAKNWDKERLLNGRIKKFQELGGKGLKLQTEAGDSIVGCYFNLSHFYEKVKNMGGVPGKIRLISNHPFFEKAEPVILHSVIEERDFSGIKIPYEDTLEEYFRNPETFIAFCKKNNYQAIWEDTLSEVTPAGYFFASRKKNIILVKNSKQKDISRLKSSTCFSIQPRKNFNRVESRIFKAQSKSSEAIIFDKNIDELQESFLKEAAEKESITWELLPYGDSTILLRENPFLGDQIKAIEKGKLHTSPIFDLKIDKTENLELNRSDKKGIVVISPHQYNNAASYPEEISQFLLMGLDVLAYDHPGVGLSEGYVTEKGLREGIFSVGNFLTENLGFQENQIIFKGECGGGIIASEASKKFPEAHLWADQSPLNYWETTESFLKNALEDLEDEKGILNKITYVMFYIGLHYLLSSISKIMQILLPNIDIKKNMQNSQGLKIYTIGTPDEKGEGGDEYVLEKHIQEIQETLNNLKGGYFLEMKGQGHITHYWWAQQKVKDQIYHIFQEKNLLRNPFEALSKKEEKKPFQAIEKPFLEQGFLSYIWENASWKNLSEQFADLRQSL